MVLGRLLANIIVAIHFGWVLTLVLGPIWAWRRPGFRIVHAVMLLGTALAWNFYCPLTLCEQILRAEFDPTGVYRGGCLEHYLRPFVDLQRYGEPLARAVQGWAVLWGLAYAGLWVREANRRRAAPGGSRNP